MTNVYNLNKAKLQPLRSVYRFGIFSVRQSEAGWGWAGLVSPVGCAGGGRVGLAVVLRVGSSAVRVHRSLGSLGSLRLLEARPVGVGPGEGGGLQGGHRLHLEREGGSSKERVRMVVFGLFPLPGLHVVFLQGYWPWLTMDLLIESTGIAHHVASCNN